MSNPCTEKEMLLLVKRTGIDKTWQVAPYRVPSEARAEKLVEFLKKAWGIPFEWKVVSL